MADHLLHAVGQDLLAEFRQELLLDAFDRGLAEFGRGLQAGDVFGPREKGPDALAKFEA